MQTTKPIVVKIGGSTLGNHDTTLQDLVTLQKRGMPLVVIHGGGNEVTSWLKRLGIDTKFVRGSRVTDKETLHVAIAVLTGLVNKELVAAITSLGGQAIGLSGIDGGLIQAKVNDPEMGYVGEVVKINTEPITTLLNAGYFPIIATAGFRLPDSEKDEIQFLNMNGDVSASEIAIALGADRLVFLTDVSGVQDSDGKVISKLTSTKAKSLIESGVISGGMIPKVEECLRALNYIPSAQILDGRVEGALLSIVEGNNTGTRIEQGDGS